MINYWEPCFFFDQDGTLNQWRWIPIETVRQEGYFQSVLPHPTVIEAARILKMEEKFCVATYGAVWDDGHSRRDKDIWMDRQVPFIPRSSRYYVPCGTEKASLFEQLVGRPITGHDILIDDNSEVLRSWEAFGGTGVKIRTAENGHHGTWDGFAVSENWGGQEIAEYLIEVMMQCYVSDCAI